MTLAKSKGLYELLQHRRRTGNMTKEEYEEELEMLKQQYPELQKYLLSQKVIIQKNDRNSLKIK